MLARLIPGQDDYPRVAFFAVHRGHKACVCSTITQLLSNIEGYKFPVWEAFNDRTHAEYFVRTGQVPNGATPIKPRMRDAPGKNRTPVLKGPGREQLAAFTDRGSHPPTMSSLVATRSLPVLDRPSISSLKLGLTRSALVLSQSPVLARHSRTASTATHNVTHTLASHGNPTRSSAELLAPLMVVETTMTADPVPKDRNKVEVWVDGDCINSTSGVRAAYSVYFGDGDPRNEAGRVPGAQTAYRGKILGMIRALEIADKDISELVLYVDSDYTINACTKWLPGWIKRGGITIKNDTVANYTMIRYLGVLVKERGDSLKLVNMEELYPDRNKEVVNKLAKEAASSMAKLPAEVDWTQKRYTLEGQPPVIGTQPRMPKGKIAQVLKSSLTVLPNSEDEYKEYDRVDSVGVDVSEWPSLPPNQRNQAHEKTVTYEGDEFNDAEAERRAAIKEGKKRCVVCPECNNEFGI